jgi:2-(1,2-epoxy-1,2-dihydrophenyl)acetyl-CoA isomerase
MAISDDVREVLTERDGAIMTVTLNRPGQQNSLTPAMLRGLGVAWHDASDDAIRAVVVTGAGRSFCTGSDTRLSLEPDERHLAGLRHAYNPSILGLAALEKPVIAAVNGTVAGAGLGLIGAADIRVGAASARFVPAFNAVGMVPDGGSAYFLVRILGYARAFDWIASGDRWTADEALRYGLLHEVVPDDEVAGRAAERALALTRLPGRAAGLTKALLSEVADLGLAQSLEREARFQARALAAAPPVRPEWPGRPYVP